jgi:hypothetical protein
MAVQWLMNIHWKKGRAVKKRNNLAGTLYHALRLGTGMAATPYKTIFIDKKWGNGRDLCPTSAKLT